MKFRFSIDLHCSQVILKTMNAVYWLYTTWTKHSKKVECQSKLLQNKNQPEFQPTDVTFWAPQENLCFLRGCLFTFIKVGVSNILQIQCSTTIMSQQLGISSFIVREDQQSFYSLHFDFHNYTVAAALRPEIFLRHLRKQHNYCPSGALSLSLTLHLQPNFDVEASGTACNSTD